MNENNLGVIGEAPTVHQGKNKKSRKKFIIGGVLVLIAIAIGLYFGYKKLNSNPMSIYKNVINETYEALSDLVKEAKDKEMDINIESDPFVLSMNATLNSSMPELKSFSGLNYDLMVGMDYKEKKANFGVGLSENNSAIVKALMSFVNKNAYLKSDEIFNKVIDLGEVDLFSEMNLDEIFKVNGEAVKFSYSDIEVILSEMRTIIINSLDKDKFELQEETIKVDNKDYNAKKVIYNLDKENMNRTIKFICDEILKNDKLLNALVKISGVDKDELKNALKDAREEEYTGEYAKTVLYTNKLNDIIAGSLIVDEEEIVKYTENNDKTKVVIKEEQVSIVIEEKDDYVSVKMSESNTEIMSLEIYENNDDIKVLFEANVEGTKVSGSIETKNVKVNKTKASGDFKLSLKTSVLEKDIDVSLDGKYSLEKKAIETINPSGSVKLENLSENEMMEAYTKISNIAEKLGLAGLLGI